MPEVYSFMVCDFVNNSSQGAPIPVLASPKTALRPEFIPGNFSFGVAIGITNIDIHKPNKFKINIYSPHNELSFSFGDAELPPSVDKDTLPAEYQGYMVCTDIRNMAIPEEGVYKISVYVNEELIWEKPLAVYKR